MVSPEPPLKQASGWTIETAMAFLQSVIDKNKDLFDQNIVSTEKAILKQEAAQSIYNANQNEWRGQLKDQVELFQTRAEADLQFQRNAEKIEELKKEIATLRILMRADADIMLERTSEKVDEVKKEISIMREAMSQRDGKGSGLRDGWAWLLGAAGLIAMLLNFFFRLKG